jgi:hypothetical protein
MLIGAHTFFSILKGFFGGICKKYRVKNSPMYRYDIEFHDGNHAEGYPSKSFHRLYLEDEKKKDDLLQVGGKVYAPFPNKNPTDERK